MPTDYGYIERAVTELSDEFKRGHVVASVTKMYQRFQTVLDTVASLAPDLADECNKAREAARKFYRPWGKSEEEERDRGAAHAAVGAAMATLSKRVAKRADKQREARRSS